MTTLSANPTNEGTYIITCAFKDSAGAAVTPNTLTWDLTDNEGNVINSRSGVSIAVPSTSNAVVLTGADLDNDQGNSRVFTIEGTYDSITYGANLPLRGQAEFTIGVWVE